MLTAKVYRGAPPAAADDIARTGTGSAMPGYSRAPTVVVASNSSSDGTNRFAGGRALKP
ncbi:UNVERIFIED_ORG: hypothetical protein ABIB13_000163 [Arthrobacter sp. UYEF2]